MVFETKLICRAILALKKLKILTKRDGLRKRPIKVWNTLDFLYAVQNICRQLGELRLGKSVFWHCKYMYLILNLNFRYHEVPFLLPKYFRYLVFGKASIRQCFFNKKSCCRFIRNVYFTTAILGVASGPIVFLIVRATYLFIFVP